MEKGTSGTPGAAIVVPFTNRRPGAPCGPRPPSFFHWRDFKDWVVGMVGKFTVDLTTKADKVSGGTAGNLASIGADGNIADSGIRSFTFDTVPTAGSSNPVTSGGIKQAIEDATPSDYEQVKAQVSQNAEDIDAVEGKIPPQASAQNQLADKEFVNSSIATNTAFYISDGGRPFQSLADLETYEGTLTNNDYAFVVGQDSVGNTTYTRYKWSEATETWAEEYVLNNSSFTAAQWAAINSGITSALVAKLGALPTAEQLVAQLLAKYEKPSTGIPKIDLSAGVQASLDKADSALQAAPVSSVNSKTGAVTLTASDVGALGNTGDQTLDGTLTLRATRIEQNKIVYDVGAAGESELIFPAGKNDYLAVLSDIYAAIQQIAPGFSWKAYALNELCTYDGAVYRCKSAYTATALSPTPNIDTTHWEVKKVSELFLPLTGGTITGDVEIIRSGSSSSVAHLTLADRSAINLGDPEYGVELSVLNNIGSRLMLWGNGISEYRPNKITFQPSYGGSKYDLAFPSASGTLALLENIAPAFSTSATYEVNKLCVYANALYRCTTAITTAGAWDSSKWTAATVQDVLAAIWAALDAKAPLASPAFTGTPTAPTPTAGDDSTKVATTAFVKAAVEGATPNLDYVMRVNPATGAIYYTTPDESENNSNEQESE